MNIDRLNSYQEKVLNLKHYQLVGIYLDSFLSGLNLEFTYGVPDRDMIFRFTGLLSIAISKDPEDEEGCFPVCETYLDVASKSNNNMILLKEYSTDLQNSKSLYFSMDGGIRIEVIFLYLQIFTDNTPDIFPSSDSSSH